MSPESSRPRREEATSRVPEGQSVADPVAVERAVTRHLSHPFRRPEDTRTRLDATRVLDELAAESNAWPSGWWVDAGCGDGSAARRLVERQPGLRVLAIDKSAARLERGRRRFDAEGAQSSATVLRMDVVDFFLIAQARGWRFERVLLCHPNPWPKVRHRGRRWYAHAIFPAMLACTQSLELRSNWPIYVEEFELAVRHATGLQSCIRRLAGDEPALSTFEEKYRASAHPLWSLRVETDGRALLEQPSV